MKNNLLKKFGMEKEYLDWKTNLSVVPKNRFVFIKGKYKGKTGTITGFGRALYKFELDETEYEGSQYIEKDSQLIKMI